MNKQFKLEGGTLVIPDDTKSLELNVEASKAVSLKRIADALEKVMVPPVSVPAYPSQFRSVFEEIFRSTRK